MATHLGQVVSNHVTLELVGGIRGGYGPEQLGWVRILPNGNKASGSGGSNYVVPTRKRLVITDLDWQFDGRGTANAGAAVSLRLFVVDGRGRDQLLMESTIVLSPAGQGGTVTSWTSGGVWGPGTRIGVDTVPLPSANRLLHAMLHGYLTD